MASPATRELIEAFTMLRNAFPEGYHRLVKAFAEYNYEVTVAVTEAPNDDILAAKGRAQNCKKIHDILVDIYHRDRNPPVPPQQ